MIKKVFTFVALIVMLFGLAVPVVLAAPNSSDRTLATAIAHAGCRGCGTECCQQGRGGRDANSACAGCGNDCCQGQRDTMIRDRPQANRQMVPPPLPNRQTSELIIGEVVAITTMDQAPPQSTGVHLQVRTDTGDISVRLGPTWYLDQQAVQLQVGDNVTVTGTRMTHTGESVMVAAEVRKGDQILILRDQAGVPVWRGGQRMSRQRDANPRRSSQVLHHDSLPLE